MCHFLEKETWMRQKTSLKKCSLADGKDLRGHH